MRAVVVHSFTSFDQIQVEELPDPTPGPGEVVVRLQAAAVNFPDLLYIEGKYQKKLDFPFAPGLAGAGLVVSLGAGVAADLLGRKVLVLPDHGTYAQMVRAPSAFCYPLPDEMSCKVAASFGLVYQAAYFSLMARAALQRGDIVLVLGATGGIGMATMQLAKALGAAKVIAATRGADRAALARELGADAVIDSAMDNLRDGMRDAVFAATNGHGADVVVDPVGGDVGTAAIRALAWNGRLVVVGFTSGDIQKYAANYLLSKNISVSGIQWTDYRTRFPDQVRDAQAHICALWKQGRLLPRIAAEYPLERFAEPLGAIKAGTARGRMILAL